MLPENDHRQLRILHGALVAGCAILLGVLHFLGRTQDARIGPRDPQLLIVLGLGSSALIPVSFLLFKRSVKRLRETFPADQPSTLRTALIQHWALLELPVLVNATCWFPGGASLHLVVAIAALIVLALRSPSQRLLNGVIDPRS